MIKHAFAQKLTQPAGTLANLATLILACSVLYIQVLQLDLDSGGCLFQVSLWTQ